MGMTLTKGIDLDCPEAVRKRAGDESYTYCGLNGHSCLIEHGLYECEIYNDYLEERGNE